MSQTASKLGGYETIQVLPDVWVAESITEIRTAVKAADTALRLCMDGGDCLPFVHPVLNSSHLWRIGYWQPRYENDEGTILDRGIHRNVGRELLTCIDALLRFSQVPHPDYVNVMLNDDYEVLPLHQDLFIGKRHLLGLAGYKEVAFPHSKIPRSVTTRLLLGPGDGYTMNFTDDEQTSLEHSVEYDIGPNVTLWVNEL